MAGYLPNGITQRDIDMARSWDGPEDDGPFEKYECDCCRRMTPADEISRCIVFGIETYACEE